MALYEVAVLTSYTTRPETLNTIGAVSTSQGESIPLDSDSGLFKHLKSVDAIASREKHFSELQKNAGKHLTSDKNMNGVEVAESATGYSISSISSWTNSSEPFLTNSSLADDALCSTKNDFDGLTFTPVAKLTPPGETPLGPVTSLLFHSSAGGDSAGSELDLLLEKVAGDIAALKMAPDVGGIDGMACQIVGQEELDFDSVPALNFNPVHSKPEDLSTGSNPYFSALSRLSDSDLFSTAPCALNDHDENSSSAFSSCRVSRSSSHCDLHDIASHASDDNFGDVESTDNEAVKARVRRLRPKVRSLTPLPSMFTPPQARGESGNPATSRDALKPLLLDLESVCSGSEAGCGRSSSGYCDSPAPSSVSSDYEFSFLNPLSQPFVPRSKVNTSTVRHGATELSGANSTLDDAQPPLTVNRSDHCQSRVADSGLEQTNAWNVTDSSRAYAARCHACDDSAYPSDTHACTFNVSINQSRPTDADHREYRFSNPEEELPPYVCKIQHGDDFVSVRDLSTSGVVEVFGNSRNLETIICISQRVVKLKVNKVFALNMFEQPKSWSNRSSMAFSIKDPEEPLLDHYGTGFAYDVDRDYVRVRTHRKVVGNATEAKNTEVTFSLALSGGECVNVVCQGLEDGFHGSAHSDGTTFACTTPPELLKHLHLFRGVPVLRRASLFNDSCYFSDSSPDTSIIDREESSGELLHVTSDAGSEVEGSWVEPSGTACQPTYAEMCKMRVGFNKKKRPHRSLGYMPSNEANNETRYSTNQLEGDTAEKISTHDDASATFQGVNGADDVMVRSNLFDWNREMIKFLQKDSQIRQAFETAPGSKRWEPLKQSLISGEPPEIPASRHAEQASFAKVGKLSSPLEIVEKRLKIVDPCPYTGEDTFGSNGLYTNFSSYSGDVLSINNIFPRPTPPPMLAPWSYESLVYLQSHRREAYNKLYNSGSQLPDTTDVIRDGRPGASGRGEAHTPEAWTARGSQDAVVNEINESTREASDSSNTPSRLEADGNQCCDGSATRGGPTVDKTVRRVNGRADSQAVGHSVGVGAFHELDDLDSYLTTWDRGLLHADEGHNHLPELTHADSAASRLDAFQPQLASPRELSPRNDHKQLIDDDYLERMVHNLIDDDDELECGPTAEAAACCRKGYFRHGCSGGRDCNALAVIISHPHGGPKMVSRGRFSRHHHTGGDLYDVPTCMGSCGAPVVAVSGTGEEVYVTQLVHAGTTRVKGITSGFGVSCFEF